MHNHARRIAALEIGRRPGLWDYAGLSDTEVDQMIDLLVRSNACTALTPAERAELDELNAKVVRRGPGPFAHLSDDALDQCIVAIGGRLA